MPQIPEKLQIPLAGRYQLQLRESVQSVDDNLSHTVSCRRWWECNRAPRLMAGEGTVASVAMIKRAIQERACLSGTHASFRVRFAPHALGRDEKGRHIVVAFEYGGVTTGRAHWMWFEVERLRDLQRTGDPWRSGPRESSPQFDLTEIEAAVDNSRAPS